MIIEESNPPKRKHKSITDRLFYIDEKWLSYITHVMYNDYGVHVYCYIIYEQHKVSLNKGCSTKVKNKKPYKISNRDKEVRIREEMKKDKNITVKRLSELTGFSIYSIYRFYMRIRRENS